MQNPVRVEGPQEIYEALGEQRQAALISAGPGVPPVRATVLNLVAYAHDRIHAAEMAAQAAALAEQHPSRTILLSVDPIGLTGDWDIHVSAHCHPAIPGYLVCFEAVELVAHGRAVDQLPAVALSLLLRDLPVILWWSGDVPVGTALFERLMASADRVLVDTASAADPDGLLRRLAALGGAERCQCGISDYNWYRLTPWRELTAQFFDAPDCRPCLESLERVRLEVSLWPGRPDWTQGYLLAAWLATRLGWAPATPLWSAADGATQITLLRGRRAVTVEFAPSPDPNAPAGLQSLDLVAQHPEGTASFTVRRFPRGARAELVTQLPGREARGRIVPFADAGPTELLSSALQDVGRDPTFAAALRMAALFSAQREAESVRRDT
ncbi:MAG TPA: glucose-6-phosphate dehydrogenase assembly protein OpcA [Anaerolineae bacterium]|nr:glucose-6-phosphate dehydrogenase assembly protein OpcA [Anaerolineae bacterium]HPL27301.1 glucose-6-phosphate dehydrogenase assembly protein OpcA [Anaerolineae bacterium]